jgi:hypothetical protein
MYKTFDNTAISVYTAHSLYDDKGIWNLLATIHIGPDPF